MAAPAQDGLAATKTPTASRSVEQKHFGSTEASERAFNVAIERARAFVQENTEQLVRAYRE